MMVVYIISLGTLLLTSLVIPSFRSPTSGWPVLFFRFRQGLRPLSLRFWQLLTSNIGKPDNKILGEAKGGSAEKEGTAELKLLKERSRMMLDVWS